MYIIVYTVNVLYLCINAVHIIVNIMFFSRIF